VATAAWAGEVLRQEPGKSGPISCKLRSVGLSPQHPQHHLRDPLLRVSQRPAAISINRKNYFQKGLDTLENFTIKGSNNHQIKPAKQW